MSLPKKKWRKSLQTEESAFPQLEGILEVITFFKAIQPFAEKKRDNHKRNCSRWALPGPMGGTLEETGALHGPEFETIWETPLPFLRAEINKAYQAGEVRDAWSRNKSTLKRRKQLLKARWPRGHTHLIFSVPSPLTCTQRRDFRVNDSFLSQERGGLN